MEIDSDNNTAASGFLNVHLQHGVPIEDFGPEAMLDDETQMIHCCICGLQIPANETGTCPNCLKNQVDATEGIERNLVMPYCKHCNRYQRPPWLACEWESRELLALCLKRMRGLQSNRRDVRLVDACFLYTEPHSRRIKVKLTLQKEVVANTVVEQDCVVEFVIQPTQCDDCKRAFTPHTWAAVVQVRQRAQHKRSLMYLEQIILKNNAHEKVLKVIEAPDGMDFQFGSKSNANKFADFVRSHLSSRSQASKQLVSHDSKSNTAFNKHTFSLEICPICKDDLVYLPPKIAGNVYGGISPFLLCTRASTAIQVVDPLTLRGFDVAGDKYWKHPFETILTRRHLTEFVVLDIEPVDLRTVATAAHAQRFLNPSLKRRTNKAANPDAMEDDMSMVSGATHATSFLDPRCDPLAGRLVDIEVARASDLGLNDSRVVVRSHLGRVLRVGDYVLGYDLARLNVAGLDDVSGIENQLPCEVILVRRARQLNAATRRRNWVLQRLPMEKATGGPQKQHNDEKMDMEEFKRDLEEDVVMRQKVNLWKNPEVSVPSATEIAPDEEVQLCELLEGLSIEDREIFNYE